MKITAWRITLKTFGQDSMSGQGAKLYGGRWNPVGYPAIYLAQHLSLVILELVVHFDSTDKIRDFIAFPFTFDKTSVFSLSASSLPQNWFELPIPSSTQQIGKKWLDANEYMVMQVPSTVVPLESNFVVNPRHKDFKHIEIEDPVPLHIDPSVEKNMQDRKS